MKINDRPIIAVLERTECAQAVIAGPEQCWIVTDGAAGNLRQASALAKTLGLSSERHDVALRLPWRWLAPHWIRGSSAALDQPLTAPWPRLVIGCGRSAAVALDGLPPLAQGGPLRVQILNPRCPPQRFDLVVAPQHDGLDGPGVVNLVGSLHEVDQSWLVQQRQRHPELIQAAGPTSLLLIGGPHRKIAFGVHELKQMLQILTHWQHRDQGELWISLSRRTPKSWRAEIRQALNGLPQARVWGGPEDGENPYPGWLACAQRIIVTPDSANMLSEACATGTPVLTHAPRGVGGRLGRLHQALRERGCLRPLKLGYQAWEYQPLCELPAVAARVSALMERAD